MSRTIVFLIFVIAFEKLHAAQCPDKCAEWFDGCRKCVCIDGNAVCEVKTCNTNSKPYCTNSADTDDSGNMIRRRLFGGGGGNGSDANGRCPLHGCTPFRLGCRSGELMVDSNGCTRCECKKHKVCPVHGCTASRLGCPSGKLMFDSDGCSQCKCAPTCSKLDWWCTADILRCSSGLMTDSKGCTQCKCKARPVVCPTDVKVCPDGKYISRDHNCEFPPCATPQCPKLDWYCTADILGCSSGLMTDSKGCKQCKCIPRTVCPQLLSSSSGSTCTASSLGCKSGQLMTTAKGCPICKCKVVPTTKPTTKPTPKPVTPQPNGCAANKDCAVWHDGCNDIDCITGATTSMFCRRKGPVLCKKKKTGPIIPSTCPKNCLKWFDGCNTCSCSNMQDGRCIDETSVQRFSSALRSPTALTPKCIQYRSLETCKDCVNAGYSWQSNRCNGTSRCVVTDVGCYTNKSECETYEMRKIIAGICKKQTSCSSCTTVHKLCQWSYDSNKCAISEFTFGTTNKKNVATQPSQCRSSPTRKPTPAPVSGRVRTPEPSFFRPKLLCVCTKELTNTAWGNTGGPDCQSKIVVNGRRQSWCYVKSGACSDGTKSERIEGFDWSLQACNPILLGPIHNSPIHTNPRVCVCAGVSNSIGHGGANCGSKVAGVAWCYVKKGSSCTDEKDSARMTNYGWSYEACKKSGGRRLLNRLEGLQRK